MKSHLDITGKSLLKLLLVLALVYGPVLIIVYFLETYFISR